MKTIHRLMNKALWMAVLLSLVGYGVFFSSVSPMNIDRNFLVNRLKGQGGQYDARNTLCSLLELRKQYLEATNASGNQAEIKKIEEANTKVIDMQNEIAPKFNEAQTMIFSNKLDDAVKILDEFEGLGNEVQTVLNSCKESIEKAQELNKQLIGRLMKQNEKYKLYAKHKVLLKALGRECTTITVEQTKKIDEEIGSAFNMPLMRDPDDLNKGLKVVTDLAAFTNAMGEIDLLQKDVQNKLDVCYDDWNKKNPEEMQQTMVDTLAKLRYTFDQQTHESEISNENLKQQGALINKYGPSKIDRFDKPFSVNDFPVNETALNGFYQRVSNAKVDFLEIENLQSESQAALHKKQLQQKLTTLKESLTQLKERLDALKSRLSILKVNLGESKKQSSLTIKTEEPKNIGNVIVAHVKVPEPTDPVYLDLKEKIKKRDLGHDLLGSILQIQGSSQTKLNLTAIPPEIGTLSDLTFSAVWFTQAKLRTLPPEIGELKFSKYKEVNGFPLESSLYLFGNELETLPPEIGNFTDLNELDLNTNKLKSLPAAIGDLSSLLSLNLSNNQLETLPPEIGKLIYLRSLNLTNNKLKTLPHEIVNLSMLHSLSIDSNVIVPQGLLDRENNKQLSILRK
jgi:Leucine-rich repeat (LRR) protein